MRYFLGNRGAYPLDGQYNLTVVLDSGGKAIQTGARERAPSRRMRSRPVVPQHSASRVAHVGRRHSVCAVLWVRHGA
jgi:hypothetical protein